MLSGPPPKVRAAGPEKASASAPPVDQFHTEETSCLSCRRDCISPCSPRMSPGKPVPKTESDLKEVIASCIPRKAWGISWPARSWVDDVGRSTCVGLHGSGRSCGSSRVHVSPGRSIGTGSSRWKLGSCIPLDVDRRTATFPVSGSPCQCDTSWKAICTSGAVSVGSNMPGLHQRNGTFVDEEKGDGVESKTRETGWSGGRCTLAKEEGSLSQETERCRSRPVNSGSTCHQHRRHDASNCKPSADCLQRGGEVPMSADFEFKCSAVPSLDADDKFKRDSLRTVSFPVWCGELLNSVLRSRTFFAAYML